MIWQGTEDEEMIIIDGSGARGVFGSSYSSGFPDPTDEYSSPGQRNENEEFRREWAQEISGWNRPQFFTELTPVSESGISAPDCQSIARLPVPQQQQQKVREGCFQLL